MFSDSSGSVRCSTCRCEKRSKTFVARLWLCRARRNGLPRVIDLAYRLGGAAGEVAGEDAAQAPADQRDRAAVLVGEVVEQVARALHAGGGRADVAAQAPAVDVVAQLAQDRAQRAGGDVVGQQAGQHQDGVAVAAREAGHQRAGGEVEAVVGDRAAGLA